jgi:hypothetical protein
MDSKMFYQRARDCLRLADECPDLYAREALMELADEFNQMARLTEADARTSVATRSRRQGSARKHESARQDAASHRQPSAR